MTTPKKKQQYVLLDQYEDSVCVGDAETIQYVIKEWHDEGDDTSRLKLFTLGEQLSFMIETDVKVIF